MENNFVSSGSNYNNYSSPRNVVQGQNESVNSRGQKSDEKGKLPFMRKNNPNVEEVEGTVMTTSPLRKGKSTDGKDLKLRALKFHEDIVKGITIAKNFGAMGEKNTPLFSYLLFKNITERLRIFREE